jgi:S-DNA-T family DNA segregation ATPase FtsK/SpoIIIE
LAGYSTHAQTSIGMLEEVAGFMSKRIPGSDITPQQLRERSWWSGPEVFVVVDDYDMGVRQQPPGRPAGMPAAGARRRPARDHRPAFRRCARALYDQVLGPLEDMSADGLLMSTPKDEGILLGDVRPAKLPPGRGTRR